MKKGTFSYFSGKMYDGMMGRCYRPTDNSFRQYGGRGIKVAAEWIKDIGVFRDWLKTQLADMGATEADFIRDRSKLSLDRVNVLGPYTPSNCRLTSLQEQTRNRSVRKRRIIVSAEGEEILF